MISFNHELSFKDINMREAKSESKTSVAFVMPIGCRPLEMPALVLKSMLKPQSLPASYQTKPPNAGIMLTPISWLALKSETVDIDTILRVSSNTLDLLITSHLVKPILALRQLGFLPLMVGNTGALSPIFRTVCWQVAWILLVLCYWVILAFLANHGGFIECLSKQICAERSIRRSSVLKHFRSKNLWKSSCSS